MDHFPYNYCHRNQSKNLDGLFDKIEKAAGKFTNWVGADTRPLLSRSDVIVEKVVNVAKAGTAMAKNPSLQTIAAGLQIATAKKPGNTTDQSYSSSEVYNSSSGSQSSTSQDTDSLPTAKIILIGVAGVAVVGSLIYLIASSSNSDKEKSKKIKSKT